MNDRSKSFGQPQSEKCSRIKSAPPNQTRVFGDGSRANSGIHSSVVGGARRAFREIVRQQWSFYPQGSTTEIEDYQVNLDSVSVLELALKPDLTRQMHTRPWTVGA
jgi:hypothetical protein